jgi:hypothetical protein
VEFQRLKLTAGRVPESLPEAISEQQWRSREPVLVVVSPLWWRDHEPPDLTVQALHDGTDLAVRLSWLDATRNDSAAHVHEFEDMAALQLFRGNPEPFLGMGSASSSIDLWQWRASWQRPPTDADSILDDYPFDTPVYRKLVEGKEGSVPDFRTARAAGNQQAHADPAQSAASLAAKGFGSTTFRPKASQRVTARAEWKDGRWTVVLRRPLRVGTDEGLALAAGEQCSVAFALWDGAARDRNGQKMISIWHDLVIE